MNKDPDAILAEKAKSDPGKFAELFDMFYPRVFTYFRYRTNDDATADELAAQVFEHLLVALNRYRPEKGPFAPWFFAIARNTANDHWRRLRRRRQVPIEHAVRLPEPNPGPEARLVTCQEEAALLAVLGILPERERDILGLKFAGGFTNREIARLMGIGESHVGVLVYRALRKLRAELEHDDE
jgi:RNA polymerase sigma-70 factor (ECF subfamily)